MPITLDGTTGITAPGVTDTGNLSVSGTSTLTGSVGNITAGTISSGAITSSGLVTGATGALYPVVQGTAQASTSGTSITFTGIPSWVKRITISFNGVSTSGTNNYLVQIGSGSVTSTGYQSTGVALPGGGTQSSTAGFIISNANAANIFYGQMTLTLVNNNTWVGSHTLGDYLSTFYVAMGGGGSPNLSGALDRVVITTVGGTDTFDAGSINIQYE